MRFGCLKKYLVGDINLSFSSCCVIRLGLNPPGVRLPVFHHAPDASSQLVPAYPSERYNHHIRLYYCILIVMSHFPFSINHRLHPPCRAAAHSPSLFSHRHHHHTRMKRITHHNIWVASYVPLLRVLQGQQGAAYSRLCTHDARNPPGVWNRRLWPLLAERS